MAELADASVLELYPDEQNKLVIICTAVSRKFMGKYNTKDNLIALANEIEGRCRDELNLDVIVDPTTFEIGRDGQPYTSPTVTVVQRLVPEIFDFAKARYETQQGFVDGNPGVITEDGRWVEPVKPIVMPGGESVGGA